MTAGTSASLCWTLHFVSVFIFVSADQETIKAEPGQNVALPCRVPDNNPITGVQWSRTDLKPQYVLLYRDGHFDTNDQHPSYKNRVDLLDRQMKDGDVSLILKYVTTADTGTYECLVVQTRRDSLKVIIQLSVVPPGPPGGAVELTVGVLVSAVLLVVAAVVGFLIYRKHKRNQSQRLHEPSAELQQV